MPMSSAACGTSRTTAESTFGGGRKAAGGTSNSAVTAAGSATFACTAIAKVRQIDLGLFKAFPEADKLDITIIGPKGQATASATRKSARVDLGKVN